MYRLNRVHLPLYHDEGFYHEGFNHEGFYHEVYHEGFYFPRGFIYTDLSYDMDISGVQIEDGEQHDVQVTDMVH